MLAFKFTYSDALEGREFKAFRVLDPATLTPHGAVNKCPTNEPDPTLNELRFKTGTTDIYSILDMGRWDNFLEYFNTHRQELIEMDERLKNDPVIQKDIAEYEKDQKAFRIWKEARKWER